MQADAQRCLVMNMCEPEESTDHEKHRGGKTSRAVQPQLNTREAESSAANMDGLRDDQGWLTWPVRVRL